MRTSRSKFNSKRNLEKGRLASRAMSIVSRAKLQMLHASDTKMQRDAIDNQDSTFQNILQAA